MPCKTDIVVVMREDSNKGKGSTSYEVLIRRPGFNDIVFSGGDILLYVEASTLAADLSEILECSITHTQIIYETVKKEVEL